MPSTGKLMCCSKQGLMAGLQAVHSGADLQSAAAAVMGYEQVTMKGKAVKVSPVPGVATARLQSLLDQVLPTTKAVPHGPGAIAASAGTNAASAGTNAASAGANAASAGTNAASAGAIAASAGAQALDGVKRLLEVRLELLPALAMGSVGCADRFRYKLASFCTLCNTQVMMCHPDMLPLHHGVALNGLGVQNILKCCQTMLNSRTPAASRCTPAC